MPRQVAGEHGKAHAQPPIHHVPVQAHVVVVTVQHQQRRHRLFGIPGLSHHLITVHLKAPQAPLDTAVVRQIQPVIGLIEACIGGQIGGVAKRA